MEDALSVSAWIIVLDGFAPHGKKKGSYYRLTVTTLFPINFVLPVLGLDSSTSKRFPVLGR